MKSFMFVSSSLGNQWKLSSSKNKLLVMNFTIKLNNYLTLWSLPFFNCYWNLVVSEHKSVKKKKNSVDYHEITQLHDYSEKCMKFRFWSFCLSFGLRSHLWAAFHLKMLFNQERKVTVQPLLKMSKGIQRIWAWAKII